MRGKNKNSILFYLNPLIFYSFWSEKQPESSTVLFMHRPAPKRFCPFWPFLCISRSRRMVHGMRCSKKIDWNPVPGSDSMHERLDNMHRWQEQSTRVDPILFLFPSWITISITFGMESSCICARSFACHLERIDVCLRSIYVCMSVGEDYYCRFFELLDVYKDGLNRR